MNTLPASSTTTTSIPASSNVDNSEDYDCKVVSTTVDYSRNEGLRRESEPVLTVETNATVRSPQDALLEGVEQTQESFHSDSEIVSTMTHSPNAVACEKDGDLNFPPPMEFEGKKDMVVLSQNNNPSLTEATNCLNLKISEVITLSKDVNEVSGNEVLIAQSNSERDNKANSPEAPVSAKHPSVNSKESAPTELCAGLQDDKNHDMTIHSVDQYSDNFSMAQETSDFTIKITAITSLSNDVHDKLEAENEYLVISKSTDNSSESKNDKALKSSCFSNDPVLSTEQLVGEKLLKPQKKTDDGIFLADKSLPITNKNKTNTTTNELVVMECISSESNEAITVSKSNDITVVSSSNCVSVSIPDKACIVNRNDSEPITVSSNMYNENNIESQRSSLADCLPIILDVRGNANDMVDSVNDMNADMNNGNDSAIEANNGNLETGPTLIQSASMLLQKYSVEVAANVSSQPQSIIMRSSKPMDYLPKASIIHTAASLMSTTSSQNSNENLVRGSFSGIATLSNTNSSAVNGIVNLNSQSLNESTSFSFPSNASSVKVIPSNGQQILNLTDNCNKFQISSTLNSYNANSSQSNSLITSNCTSVLTSHSSRPPDHPQISSETSSVSAIFNFYDIKTEYALRREEIMDRHFLDIVMEKRLDLSKQFHCNVCGDEFHTEEFFNFHLNRKIFNLNYYCSVCQKFIEFSNKCSFWQHLKNESLYSRKRIDCETTMMVMKAFLPSASTMDSISTHTESPLGPAQVNISSITNKASDTTEAENIPRNVPAPEQAAQETSKAMDLSTKAVDVPIPTDVVNIPTEAVNVPAVRSISVLSTTSSEFLSRVQGPHSNSATSMNEMEHASVSISTIAAPTSVVSHSTVTQAFCSTSSSSSSLSETVASKENVSFPKTCPFCQKDFPTKSEWNAHFKRTSYNTYHCNVCEMVMFNLCSYSAHRSIHTLQEKRRTILCPECGESLHLFSDLKHVFEHLDACCHFNLWYKMKCHCGVVVYSVNKAKDHFMQQHLNPIVSCYDCGHRFNSLRELLLHCNTKEHIKAGVQEKIIFCTLCGGKFKSPSLLQKHVEDKVNHLNVMTKDKIYVCYLCQYCSKDASDLNEHVESVHVHKPKRCTLCFTLFKSRQKLVTHIVSKECSRTFPKHLHQSADDPSEREMPFDNSQYSKIFTITDGNPALSLSSSLSVAYLQTNTAMPTPSPSVSNEDGQISNDQQATHNNVTVSKTNLTPANKEKSPVIKITVPLSKSPANKTVRHKFQCHLCKICLNGLKNYEKHMSHHPSIDLQTFRTHCVVCKKMVVGSTITAHMKLHQEAGIIVCVLCHRRDFTSVQLAQDHARNWCFYTEVIGWGEDILKGREKERGAYVQNAVNIGTDNANKDVNNENVSQPEKESNESTESLVFPCLMCGLAFSTKSAKEDHVGRVHDGTRILFICLLCKKRGLRKKFHKRHKACLHIMRKHRIVAPAEVSKLIGEEEQNISNGEVIRSESSSQDVVNGAPPPKRLRLQCEGSYLCGRCGFADASNDVFAKHIKTHNSRGEPQCLECGLCFTVVAALKRHLFAVHKIKNMDSYLKEKGIDEAVDEEQVSDDEESTTSPHHDECVDTVQSNETRLIPIEKPVEDAIHMYECKVCYRKYACEEALQSHMRNHGMAFIRSRRRALTNKT